MRTDKQGRKPFKQYLGGGKYRLIRKRPLFLTEETLLPLLEELKEKQAKGWLEVQTLKGETVDLDKVGKKVKPAPPPPPPPPPKEKKKIPKMDEPEIKVEESK